jgi:thioredoxin 1
MTSLITDLTETVVFDLKVNSEAPVIVKFQSESCVICKKMEPFLLAVAKQFSGQVHLGDVDVEKNEKLVSRYQIRGLPTLILFNQGREISRRYGFQTGGMLRAWLGQDLP